MVPHDPLDIVLGEIVPQCEKSTGRIKHLCAVANKNVSLELLRVLLHLRATKFVGAVRPGAAVCLAVS